MDYYSVALFHMGLHFSDKAPSSFLDFLTVFSDLLNHLKLGFPCGGSLTLRGHLVMPISIFSHIILGMLSASSA